MLPEGRGGHLLLGVHINQVEDQGHFFQGVLNPVGHFQKQKVGYLKKTDQSTLSNDLIEAYML